MLLAGTLGDRFGRRRTLILGLTTFGVASAAAAFAGGVGQLVTARAVMGAGAAFIMPATLSLLTSVFTDARERAMAIGIWAATAGVGVAMGPVVGGFLLDHFWWGSVFIVNVPIVVAAIVTARLFVPESRDPVARRTDWTGAALSGVGLVAFVWAIIEAPSKGWTSSPVLAAAVLSAVALGACVAWERRVDEPLLDVRLFRNARFTAASITSTTGYGRLAIAMLFMGAGMGFGAPATESIMGALPRDRAGIGSAVNDTTRELGGALGVAIVGSIVSSLYGNQLALPARVPAPVADAARESLGAAVQIGGEVGTQVAAAAREAFVHAMSWGSIVVACVAVIGGLIAWRYLPARAPEQPSAAECATTDATRSGDATEVVSV